MRNIAAAMGWDGNLVETSSLLMVFAGAPDEHAKCHAAAVLTYAPSGGVEGADLRPLVFAEGRYSLVAEARIDNQAELVKDLNSAGGITRSSRVTEVIAAGFLKWGERLPERLVGDFAFVVWDSRERRLFAARDPFGMCTLHYTQVNQALLIATEVKQLLAHPQVRGELQQAAALSWLAGRPDANLTLFKGIEILPPGHRLLAHGSSCRIERYWSLDPAHRIEYRDLNEYQEHLRALLERAVNDRLQGTGDAIATQMSGGMDSTTVTALAGREARRQNKQLLVLSHTYDSLREVDETQLIRETARYLEVKGLKEIPTEPYTTMPFAELYPPTLDSPGTVVSPRYVDEVMLTRDAGARVLLTGSGGDEMTWGHALSYTQRFFRADISVLAEVVQGCHALDLPVLKTLYRLLLAPAVPEGFRQRLRGLKSGAAQRHAWPDWIPDVAALRLDLEARSFAPLPRLFANRALQARYSALARTSTVHAVRSYAQAGKLHDVDVRHPFFDRRLAEFSFAIPDDLWSRCGYSKWLLRKTMQEQLPPSVCWKREKVTFTRFFAGILRDQAESIRDILADERLQSLGLVHNRKLLAAFDRTITGTEPCLDMALLYTLLMQLWVQRHGQQVGV